MVSVLIVGGGPVGLALAVELGTRGIECLLVERGDGRVAVPKMTQLTARTVEFCRRWGLVDEVRQAAWPEHHPGDFVYLTSLAGYELFRQRVPPRAEQPELNHTPERPYHCPQILFDPMLLRRAAVLPTVMLCHRTQLDSFVQDAGGVHARLTDLTSGETRTVDANYLVGCDGFDGHVRKALGVEYHGSGLLSFSISIYFKSAVLAALHDKGWARFYRFVDASGHWGDLIAIDGRELWRLTLLDADPATDVEAFDVEGCLRRAAGFPFPHEIFSVLPWRRRELVADRYRQDRVFIAGDAAHQMSPTGGLGMNTGVADVVDLGWKLAAVLEGWGGDGLLDSYEAERRPVAVQSVTASSRIYQETTSLPGGAAIAEDSPAGERLRQRFAEAFRGTNVSEPIADNVKLGYCYEGSPIIWPDGTPPPDDAAPFMPTARPGTRAPHAWIAPGCSTLDRFGQGFVLLRFGQEPVAVPGLIRSMAAHRVPLQVVDISDPTIAALYERNLVLVRPDGHVVWRADACPDDTNGLVERVRGATDVE